MSLLKVELVAADRRVWEGEASQIGARTTEGEIGIMPGHQPVLAVLIEGDVRIHREGKVDTARIDTGFLSVNQDVVTIVAEQVDASQMSV